MLNPVIFTLLEFVKGAKIRLSAFNPEYMTALLPKDKSGHGVMVIVEVAVIVGVDVPVQKVAVCVMVNVADSVMVKVKVPVTTCVAVVDIIGVTEAVLITCVGLLSGGDDCAGFFFLLASCSCRYGGKKRDNGKNCQKFSRHKFSSR